MSKQPHVSKRRNPKWAMLAADAFVKNSRLFTGSLPKDLNQSANAAVGDLGGLFASATNLALATELYLKSLMILLGMDIPNTHDLWAIFTRLPPQLIQDIEKEFDSSCGSLPEHAVGLVLAIWTGTQPEAPLPEVPKEKKRDLKSILRRSKDAFVTWRYIYEMGVEGRHALFEYEYGRLGVFCEILRRMIQSGPRFRKKE